MSNSLRHTVKLSKNFIIFLKKNPQKLPLQYAPKSWTCQFRQLRGVASKSRWQHHCIYSLWAGEWNNMTNFSTDGCRNPQKVPNYSFGIFQFLAEFLKIIIWNQSRCCWLGSVYGASPVARLGHRYSAHPYFLKQGGPRKFWPKWNLYALIWILTCQKENLPKVTLKAKIVTLSDFSLKLSPLDPYIWLTREGINGIKSIPEFRYGSLLYPPSKIFACCYTFLGLLWPFSKKPGFQRGLYFWKWD